MYDDFTYANNNILFISRKNLYILRYVALALKIHAQISPPSNFFFHFFLPYAKLKFFFFTHTKHTRKAIKPYKMLTFIDFKFLCLVSIKRKFELHAHTHTWILMKLFLWFKNLQTMNFLQFSVICDT